MRWTRGGVSEGDGDGAEEVVYLSSRRMRLMRWYW